MVFWANCVYKMACPATGISAMGTGIHDSILSVVMEVHVTLKCTVIVIVLWSIAGRSLWASYRLVMLAFCAAIGITLLVLGCALPAFKWVQQLFQYSTSKFISVTVILCPNFYHAVFVLDAATGGLCLSSSSMPFALYQPWWPGGMLTAWNSAVFW